MLKPSDSKKNTSATISALISEIGQKKAWWPFLVTFVLLAFVKIQMGTSNIGTSHVGTSHVGTSHGMSVQAAHAKSMFIADRFIAGTGWIEIVLASVYASWVYLHMKNPKEVARWRKNTWLLFTVVFFSQLVLGILADKRFLMTGRLHLPIPAMILSGPIYRLQLSFMPILFLSTVVITGPAWCSQLCYFGSLDNWASSAKKPLNKPLKNKGLIKHAFLLLFITIALLFHLFGVSNKWATVLGIAAGIVGLAIIVIFSRKRHKMVHCTMYCPIGTLVNYLRYISPFRMYITDTCTTCMACTVKCRYDALNLKDIQNLKPGKTCTYCGECLSACHHQSIRYRFLGMHHEKARDLFLILTLSLHACFLVLARI